jgi:hypothetical protein
MLLESIMSVTAVPRTSVCRERHPPRPIHGRFCHLGRPTRASAVLDPGLPVIEEDSGDEKGSFGSVSLFEDPMTHNTIALKTFEKEVNEAIGPLNGIIAHLTRECCGNVAEHRLVRVEGAQFVATMRNVRRRKQLIWGPIRSSIPDRKQNNGFAVNLATQN